MGDAGYFIEQIAKHADYGRQLYTQLEFPYGPLIFYGPIWVRSLLRVPLATAYCITLVVEQALGLFMLTYVLNHLPMLRRWKILFLILCAVLAVPVNLGLNYTFFRFIMPAFLLVLTARRPTAEQAALFAFAGQIVALAVSPEIGLAFFSGAMVLHFYRSVAVRGRWWFTLAAPAAATAVFMLLMGRGYLRMLGLFAGGINNLIVEPVPFILVFLFALIGMVPLLLVRALRQRLRDAPMLSALYVSALATLPAGFGRADPQHTFFNGIAIYLLSFVAISFYNPRKQLLWATVAALTLLWTAKVTALYPQCIVEYHSALYGTAHRNPKFARILLTASRLPGAGSLRRSFDKFSPEPPPIDENHLASTIGNNPIATPLVIPLSVEDGLKRSGRYIPTFYCFQTAILDYSAEDRELAELNQANWMLLPQGPHKVNSSERPEDTAWMMGLNLHYHSIRQPYDFRLRFDENLNANWHLVDHIDGFDIYRRNGPPPTSE
jgi:hypothetical protein